MESGTRDTARWKKILLGLAALLVLAAGAGLSWLAANARDLVWSQVSPEHAALLEGQEIPERLSADAWREDLAYLAGELPRRLVRFDRAVDRAAFEAEVAALEELLPELSRERTILELMGIAALPGTGIGHTGIPPMQRPLDWRFYPIYTWLFDDGPWITLAGAGAEEALGARILAVGGRPVEEILEEAAPFLPADNEIGRKALLGAVFSFAEMLQALGAADANGAELTLVREEGGGPFEVRLEPVALASVGGLRWGRVLQEQVEGVWSPADPRPRSRTFDFEYHPESGLLYLQLNEVRDQPGGETLAELAERLGKFVEEHEIERFVLDLRSNGGGNNQLVEPLVEMLSGHPKIDRRGVLYTLIGRRTYSAAGNLAAALERRTKTLFAGEPTGSAPNHFGDAISRLLPRSKVIYRLSTRYWEDGGPWDRRRWIAPSALELAVPLTSEDHFEGRDPVLAAVLAHEAAPIPPVPLDPVVAASLAGSYRLGPFRVLEIGQDGGRLRMEARGVDTFLASELYFPAAEGGRGDGAVVLATDLPDVFVRTDPAGGHPTLDWRGVTVPLVPVPEGYRLPIDRVREGPLDEGIAAFRELAAAGRVPDSRTELELNRIGYRLLEEGRTEEAIEVFRLQTELYPEVANSFDSLGDAYRQAGDGERAAAAYRASLEIDPGFRHSRKMLEELGTEWR